MNKTWHFHLDRLNDDDLKTCLFLLEEKRLPTTEELQGMELQRANWEGSWEEGMIEMAALEAHGWEKYPDSFDVDRLDSCMLPDPDELIEDHQLKLLYPMLRTYDFSAPQPPRPPVQQLGLTLPVEGTGRKRRMGPAVRAFQTPDGRRARIAPGVPRTLRAVMYLMAAMGVERLQTAAHGHALVQRLLLVMDDREAAEAVLMDRPFLHLEVSGRTVMLGLKDLMEHLGLMLLPLRNTEPVLLDWEEMDEDRLMPWEFCMESACRRGLFEHRFRTEWITPSRASEEEMDDERLLQWERERELTWRAIKAATDYAAREFEHATA